MTGQPRNEPVPATSAESSLIAAGDSTPDQLIGSVEDDRDRRWLSGDRRPAEEYLAAHPSLAADPERALQLVYGEYLLRERLGEAPSADEYARRFPGLADRLRQQVELHLALGGPADFMPDDTLTWAGQVPMTGPALPDVPGYELFGELGRGGMAVVYRARDTRLNRTVALKLVKTGSLPGRAEVARFRAEAEAVARLRHPHVVQIFEVGEAGGLPYMALEFVPGGTLAGRLRDRTLPPREAAELVEVLARALDAAHRAGVIHRDLKPGNVLLAEDGSPRVADFGLAKRLDAADGNTRTGDVLGTPSYMAPEQAGGDPGKVGPAADVYALGAILYECLTGRPPFRGVTILDTLEQVRSHDPVTPSKLVANVPRDLEAVCLKCLEKAPANRYPSAAALADDLRRWLDGKPTLAKPVGVGSRVWKRVRRNPALSAAAAVTALALVIGGGGAAGSWYQAVEDRVARAAAEGERDRAAADRAKAETDRVTGVAATETRRREEAALFLSRALADRYWQQNAPAAADRALDDCPVHLRGWDWHFRRHRHEGGGLAVLAARTEVGAVAFSPDGRTVATGDGDPAAPDVRGVVALWDLSTGLPLGNLSGHTAPVRGVVFSPDGKTLLSASRRVDDLGALFGDPRRIHEVAGETIVWDLARRRPRATLLGVAPIALSADGSVVAACAAGKVARVWAQKEGTFTEVRRLPDYKGRPLALALSPDGRRLAMAGFELHSPEPGDLRYRVDLDVYEVATGKKLWSPPEAGQTRIDFRCLAFTPDGDVLAAGDGNGGIRFWDAETGRPRQRLREAGEVNGLAFSGDGRHLAAAVRDRAVHVWDWGEGELLRTYRGHDKPPLAVAFGPPAGKRLPLVSVGEDGLLRLWDARRDAEFFELDGAPGVATSLGFSPDGKRIAAVNRAKGELRVWDAATGEVTAVLPALAEKLAFGGNDLVATAGGRGAGEVGELKLWDLARKDVRFTLRGHRLYVLAVAFSADGRRLASAGGNPQPDRAEAEDVVVWDPATGGERLRFRSPVGVVRSLAFSPDGKYLATGGSSRAVAVHDPVTGQLVGDTKAHPGTVLSLAYSPDGKTLAVGDEKGFVTLWTVTDWGMRLRERWHEGGVSSLAFEPRPDGLLASASLEVGGKGRGEVRLWDPSDGREVLELPGMMAVAFSPNGRRLAAATRTGLVASTGAVRVWDAPPSALRAVLWQDRKYAAAVDVSPDGRLIAAGFLDRGDTGGVTVWDAVTRRPVTSLKGLDVPVPGLAFSPDGTRLVTCEQETTVRLWDARTGEPIRSFVGHSNTTNKARFFPDGRRFVTAAHDLTARVWDAETGAELLRLEHARPVREVAVSPDGRRLATCWIGNGKGLPPASATLPALVGGAVTYRDTSRSSVPPPPSALAALTGGGLAHVGGGVRLWNATTGALEREFTPFGLPISLAFGRGVIAAGCADGIIRVWDPDTGVERTPFVGHGGPVWGVAIDHRGILWSVSDDQTVRTWDLVSRKPLAVSRGHHGLIRGVAVAADGWAATAGYDGTVRLWNPPETP